MTDSDKNLTADEIEVTPEMIRAGRVAEIDTPSKFYGDEERLKAIYLAMIQADDASQCKAT